MLGRRVLDVVDPDHAEELLHRRVEREAADAHAQRDLRISPAGPGLNRVSRLLDTEGTATLRAALDPLAAPRPRRPRERRPRRPHPRPTHGRRPGGAGRAVPADGRPARPRRGTPTLIVTMPYDKLAAATGVGTLDGGDVLPASQVRRIAYDPKIIPAVLGTRGEVLDLAAAPGTTSERPAGRLFSGTADGVFPAATDRTNGATATTASTGPTAAEQTRTTASCSADTTTASYTTTAGT